MIQFHVNSLPQNHSAYTFSLLLTKMKLFDFLVSAAIKSITITVQFSYPFIPCGLRLLYFPEKETVFVARLMLLFINNSLNKKLCFFSIF